jgi:hypothetical protein
MTVEDLEGMARQKELDEKVFCLQGEKMAFEAGLSILPYNLLQPEVDCMNNAYSLQKKAIYFLAVWFQTN